MPDYKSILRRSIENVPDHTADMRRAIYERARATIARQLTSVDPPLSAESIEAQHQLLEQSIAEVEAEYALEEIDPVEFEAEIGLHESSPGPDIQELDDEDEQRPSEALIDYGSPGAGHQLPRRPVEIRPSRAPLFILLGLIVLAGGGASVLGYKYQDEVTAFIDRFSAPEEPMVADAAPGGDGGSGDIVVADGAANDTAPADAGAADAGGSALAKSEERLGDVVRADSVNNELRGSEPGMTIQPMTNAAGMEKPTDEPASPLASTSQDGATDGSPAEGTMTTAAAAGSPAAGGLPESDPVVTGAAGPANVDVGTDTVGISGQRAIYYTQGVDDTPGEASEGKVTWTKVQQPDGLPAIQGRIDVADPNIDVVITIAKNTDPGLPASHLIEITFEGIENLSDSAIERIPAIVLKPNEQARGQPLVGAGVPVTDSMFWIALSDKSDQVSTNIATLRDGSWFDMPLLFKDQKRALITFEKGGEGEALFKEVMAAWEAS